VSKQADLILVDLSALNLLPGAVTQRVAADPVHTGMALLAEMEAGRL
jgi:hypothetical protein